MGLPHLQTQLKILIRVVADHQIPVRIGAGSAAAEGLSTVAVRKYIMGMTVAFHHCQRRVQSHPENQIGQLAQSAPHIAADPAQEQQGLNSVFATDSTTLAGTLVVPEGEGPFPALLFITGSGAQDRNEEMWNYQPFFMIADHLARQGFATLRMDDRGTGKSGGSYAGTTLQSAAADAECALDYLRQRPETDPGRTGLIGHSMGGTIAFRIAARRPQDVACVVALAGATQKGKDWIMEQCEKSVLQLLPPATGDSLRRSYAGLYDALSHPLPPDSARERCLPYMLDIWQRLDIFPEELREDLPESRRMDNARFLLRATITPEFASLVQYDPTDDLKRTACPVWAAYGEKDMQVIPERNLQAIEAHTKGNPHVTTRIYPGLNHLFLPARTGLPTEYPELKGNFSPQVLQDMAEWLKRNINL